MRALIIEDNPKMQVLLEQGLTENGFTVDKAETGREGEELGTAGNYDVILLDIMLPDRDGVDVCKNLRRREVATPVLMLTALSETEHKVEGLDAGADDYLGKPFEFEELIARVRALLRRGTASESRVLEVADLQLDLYTREATRGETHVELSNREFALLEYLMRNPNRVLSRAQIGEGVWDVDYQPTSNVVDVYISALRRKLDKGFDRELFQTIKGAGYRFGLMVPSGQA